MGAACLGGPRTGLAQDIEETAKDIIAAQIRSQAYRCENPRGAQRDPEHSRPDEPVWILDCENHSYRVRLVPNQAAKVETLGAG
ncbi:hypothetical protein BXY53_0796 [Dichotomicrobium thermohalophilum]|uniref:PepSY domain-containing protein n=1 Tax=Dichotomicrobium thermohalophilum TaxID=933063 RepID=A0A397Q2J0_9HYPH|nr:hypothetical protein BXY53_0796 [Dichotomicrobium thermohalophilum]